MATVNILVTSEPLNLIDTLALSIGERRLVQNVGSSVLRLAELSDDPGDLNFGGKLFPGNIIGITVASGEAWWVWTNPGDNLTGEVAVDEEG